MGGVLCLGSWSWSLLGGGAISLQFCAFFCLTSCVCDHAMGSIKMINQQELHKSSIAGMEQELDCEFNWEGRHESFNRDDATHARNRGFN